MRSAERLVRTVGIVRRTMGSVALLLLALSAGSCGDKFEPLSNVETPASVVAVPMRLKLVRVQWKRVNDPDLVSYVIERRANLTGPFHEVAQVPQSGADDINWLDTDIEPDMYYGYRVIAINRFGDRSPPSVVGGIKSPSLPGIEVQTASVVSTSTATDPDGYVLTILGPDTIKTAINQTADLRFSPLKVGTYIVSISGLAPQCVPSGPTTASVVVTDTVAKTIAQVSFSVRCRDATLGDITVTLHATGRDIDNAVDIELLGEASDHSLPDSVRVVSRRKPGVALVNSENSFLDLRPGTYDITITDLAENCTLTGPSTKTVVVTPLGNSPVRFDATCRSISAGAGPFFLRQEWLPAEAPRGAHVILRTSLDLTADTTKRVGVVQARVFYDPAVLHFEDATAGQLGNLTVGTSTPGLVGFLAATASQNLRGLVKVLEIEFSVIGQSGSSMETSTIVESVVTPQLSDFATQVSPEDAEFTVSAGSANQAPIATANGPYSGVVNTPVNFTANGSSDPDGTIASYSWAFGDGQNGTGATTTHTYTTAGTYTATLTVTDNTGATATSTATVTITPSQGPGNQVPIAEANGPYSATAGVAFTLSSSGSHDNDGSIASYSWNLGNGQSASGASPSVTYASAGTYIVTLTVTDDKGATATDQATVNVANPAPSQPMIWSENFGPIDQSNIVSITVNFDTRADVPETSGPEALETFVLDSLKWNPAVLQFYSVNLGPGITGTTNQAKVTSGNIAMRGTLASGFQQGLIQIAVVRFRVIGASGSQASTSTYLGSLIGPASTNTYVYNAKTRIIEGTFTTP